MADERDLTEFRRDVVEARNQAIKTDNQVKNLALDIKAFEQRFAVLEKRTRIASLGTNIMVALIIMAAAYLAHTARVRSMSGEVERLRSDLSAAQGGQNSELSALRARLAEGEAREKARTDMENLVGQLIDDADAKRDKQAAELMEKVDPELLSPLAQRLAGKKVQELRRHAAETAYRSARTWLTDGKIDRAVVELRRSLQLDPQGHLAGPSRYLLAYNLWVSKHFDEAVPVLRDMQKLDADKAPGEEIRFLLGSALARLGEREEASKLLRELSQGNGRYAAVAKSYLAALEAGSELPLAPGERKAAAAAPASAEPVSSKD